MPTPRSARRSRPSPRLRPDTSPPDGPMRLQRFLAAAGLGSRRQCEEYIVAGRIAVDGETVEELGTRVDPGEQSVSFDGEQLRLERKKYFALNKPVGFLCTHRDPGGRLNVTELFPSGPRLFAVGRLDETSEGLLIVTNDGDLGNKLAHPRYRIDRTYLVQVAGHPPRATLDQLERGMHFSEGKFRAQSVRPIKKQGKSTFLEIRLREGRNREIRRLLARVGHKVMKLQRVGFGPIRLGKLKPSEYRELRPTEIASLQELVKKTSQSPAATGRRKARKTVGGGPAANGPKRRRADSTSAKRRQSKKPRKR